MSGIAQVTLTESELDVILNWAEECPDGTLAVEHRRLYDHLNHLHKQIECQPCISPGWVNRDEPTPAPDCRWVDPQTP